MRDALDSLQIPPGLMVCWWGGGVDSTAALALMHLKGIVPKVIIMADPGSEWPETYEYRDKHLSPWLEKVGFPPLTVVSRWEELEVPQEGKNFETLAQRCFRTGMWPSAAYFRKKCSQNFKAAPQRWWMERQEWPWAEWDAGLKIVKVIGYDADEDHRIKHWFGDKVENARYVPWYPLWEAEIDRDGCKELIRQVGLAVPRKSACYFCPFSTLRDWIDLRASHPKEYAHALTISRVGMKNSAGGPNAGLMLCNPHGKRLLHMWHEGRYPEIPQSLSCEDGKLDLNDMMPCECAL